MAAALALLGMCAYTLLKVREFSRLAAACGPFSLLRMVRHAVKWRCADVRVHTCSPLHSLLVPPKIS